MEDPHTEVHRSASEVLQDILTNVEEIVRSEMRLARTEIKEEAAKAGQAGAALGAAALLGFFGLALCIVLCIVVLIQVISLWAATLLMAGLCLIGAGILFAIGHARLKQVHAAPPKTVHSLKEDATWLKTQTR